MIARIAAGLTQRLRSWVTTVEGRWFDLTRGVRTSGWVSLSSLMAPGADRPGFDYLPTRPSRARAALRNLPIGDYSQYVFVDLGSGKGRMLFLASEFPFQSIEGVEFAAELHRQAVENIARCRRVRRRCDRIQSFNLDAAEYPFPMQALVLYLFNPFGAAVLRKVLSNLNASWIEHPRHVVLVLMAPETARVADALPWLICHRRTPHCHIYQTEVRELRGT